MVNGKMQIDVNVGGDTFDNVEPARRRRSVENEQLNDNEWHSYSVRIKNGYLELLVDGQVAFKKQLSPQAIAALNTGILTF
jgi:hypothetical protein